MPLYIGDYLADTIGLSHSQHGAYLLALMAYWRKGGPLSEEETKSIMGEHATSLSRFFRIESDGWHSKRADLELSLSQENSERNKARTAAATKARLKRNVNVTSNVTFTPSPSPSPSPLTSPESSPSQSQTPSKSECVNLPLAKQKQDFHNAQRFKWLSGELCRLYKRPIPEVGRGEEEHLVADVSRRPDVKDELAELIKARSEIGERYFPQSLMVLCRDWDKTLDRARNHAPPPKPFKERSIAEKESDRLCAQIMRDP